MPLEFGTFLLLQSPSARPSQEIYARGVEIAEAAEDLGFRNMWLAEHHFSTYGYLSRPLILAQHIADRTKDLRVGTAVIVAPLHHPLVIAEEIATVDQLSGGRLDVGLGRGYQPYEFVRLGLKLEDSRARWEEEVDIILQALAGQPFSYHGQFYDFPETSTFPEALQKPYPPFWVAAQSPESITAAVRRGFNVITGGAGAPLERLAEYGELFRRTVAEVKPTTSPILGVQRPVYVCEDEGEARRVAEQARWNMRVATSLRLGREKVEKGRAVATPLEGEVDTNTLLEQSLVVGTPETCIKQLESLRDRVGIELFNDSFWFGDLSHEQVLSSMEMFAKQVKPQFNQRVPVA